MVSRKRYHHVSKTFVVSWSEPRPKIICTSLPPVSRLWTNKSCCLPVRERSLSISAITRSWTVTTCVVSWLENIPSPLVPLHEVGLSQPVRPWRLNGHIRTNLTKPLSTWVLAMARRRTRDTMAYSSSSSSSSRLCPSTAGCSPPSMSSIVVYLLLS